MSGRPEEASSSGEDEAEFAWLPVDCLKPFQPSDAGAVAAADASNGEPSIKIVCMQTVQFERMPQAKLNVIETMCKHFQQNLLRG